MPTQLTVGQAGAGAGACAGAGQAVAHGEYIRTNTCEGIYTIYTVILLTGHLARARATDTLTNTHECVFVALNRHFHS